MGVKTPIYFPKWESLEPVMQTHLLSKLINKIGDKKIHLRVISPEFEYLNYGFPWLNNKNAGTVAGDARNRIFSLKLTSYKYIRKFFPLTQDNPEAPEIISFIKEWKGPVIIMNAVGEDVRHTTFNKIAETAFYIKMVDQAPKGAFLYDL